MSYPYAPGDDVRIVRRALKWTNKVGTVTKVLTEDHALIVCIDGQYVPFSRREVEAVPA